MTLKIMLGILFSYLKNDKIPGFLAFVCGGPIILKFFIIFLLTKNIIFC